MSEALTQIGPQIGVYGIFALLVIDKAFLFAGKKKNGNGSDLKAMAEIVKLKDADGVPRCYTPRSLERTLDKLANNVAEQSEILKDMGRSIRGCDYNIHKDK